MDFLPPTYKLSYIPTYRLPPASHLKQEEALLSTEAPGHSLPIIVTNSLDFPPLFSAVPSLLTLPLSIETGFLAYRRKSPDPISPLVLAFLPFLDVPYMSRVHLLPYWPSSNSHPR